MHIRTEYWQERVHMVKLLGECSALWGERQLIMQCWHVQKCTITVQGLINYPWTLINLITNKNLEAVIPGQKPDDYNYQ